MDARANAPETAAQAQRAGPADPRWYMDAIIYQLHVKAFLDSNGDGIGDFRGLTSKLDYIRDLGVNTVWLLPFYPSPLRDDGYDVADYHDVHPAYGTLPDFKAFVREAHRRELRVITELVVNHTSDAHPWFQAARRAPRGSIKRSYYVWSDDPARYAGTRIIFTDTETSNWAWDEVAQQYYWHRFFSHQPDLNFDNPHVLKAVVKTMRYWLDMGVDGFRLDAIPYLVEREGTSNENLPETHAVVKRIRAALDESHRGKLLLAEANQWPEDVRQYFGDGDECHMAYHFPLMPRLFLSIAMEDRHPLLDILAQTPPIPENCQWAIFLRNHDELTLEMVTARERDYLYGVFATDPRMRVNVGIRRRLAPLMENDRDRIELITFLLMTMPGAPILYYGDEIGMGDNIYLGDRNGVRTPMQWSPDRNAGFSRADPQRLFLPPVMDPIYGYEAVNVEAQQRSASSLLNWTRRLIAMRRRYRAFGRGTFTFLEPGNRKVLAFIREHEDCTVLCVANLARTSQAVELDLASFDKRVPVEMLGGESFPPVGRLPYLLTLPGHGYFAFRLDPKAAPPPWHMEKLLSRRLPVLVLAANWQAALAARSTEPGAIFHGVTPQTLRDLVLLPWLRSRRWFAARSEAIRDARFAAVDEWKTPEGDWWLAFIDVELASGERQRYFVPLALAWESRELDPVEQYGEFSVARVRQRDRMGVLYGAYGNPGFARAVARTIGAAAEAGRPREIALGDGMLRFSATLSFGVLAPGPGDAVRIAPLDQSNTGVFLGNRLYLKGYRRMGDGVNPELEIGLFLGERSPYAHAPALAGAVEFVRGDGAPSTLAVAHRYVENQGDLWSATVEHLDRLVAADAGQPAADRQALANAAPARMDLLGRRVAELHRAFAAVTGDPGFDPEPVTPQELRAWHEATQREARATLDALAAGLEGLAGSARPHAEALLARREAFLQRLAGHAVAAGPLVKTRCHGDLHLGQVLVAQGDFAIVDFEGEPGRPIEARRRKHCVLRDVAGMLRSIHYAAHAAELRPTGDAAPEAARLKVDAWAREAAGRFLAGYRAAGAGVASIPADATQFDALLDLFTVEKALYEVRYELSHRPDWAAIPLRGLHEWIER